MNELLGKWRLDSSDSVSVKMFGDVSMTFCENGELIYTVHLDNKEQIIFMTYRIEGDKLITDQSSNPNEQLTEFQITSEDKLELKFDGEKSIYLRET